MSPRKRVKARHAKNICAVQNVAIIYDDRMLAHQPPEGQDCDEKPERLVKRTDWFRRGSGKGLFNFTNISMLSNYWYKTMS